MRCRLEGDASVDGGASCFLRHAPSAVMSTSTPPFFNFALCVSIAPAFRCPLCLLSFLTSSDLGPGAYTHPLFSST